MTSRRRRLAAAALALVGVSGLTLASAAQLSVGGAGLGAGTSVVSSCQPAANPIGVQFVTAYRTGGHTATHVRVTGVHAACGGKNARVQLVSTTGAPLGAELVGAVPPGGGSWTIDIPDVAAASLGGVSGVVHD